MGTHYFAGIDGEWADDPDALAAALDAEWPALTVTRATSASGMAYELELGGDLGSLHADGRAIAFKHSEQLVVAWRCGGGGGCRWMCGWRCSTTRLQHRSTSSRA